MKVFNVSLNDRFSLLHAVCTCVLCIPLLSGCFDRSKSSPQPDLPINGTMPSQPVIVGGAPMKISRTILDNTALSRTHTTLVALLERTLLKETLQKKGPFTVFAPTNQAFDTLPPGTVEQLFKADNLPALTDILNYHIIDGELDSRQLRTEIKDKSGRIKVTTMQGKDLTLLANGESNIMLIDSKGNIANIVIYDAKQANGIVHVIDQVLSP